MDIFHIFKKEFDFFTVFPWQAISGCVRDVYHGCTSFNHGFYYACQIHIVCPSGIFAIKFHVFHEFFSIFGSCNCAFEDFILRGIEFILYMLFRSTYSSVDSSSLGILKRFGCHFNVFLHAACECADSWPGYGFRNFYNRFEITRT